MLTIIWLHDIFFFFILTYTDNDWLEKVYTLHITCTTFWNIACALPWVINESERNSFKCHRYLTSNATNISRKRITHKLLLRVSKTFANPFPKSFDVEEPKKKKKKKKNRRTKACKRKSTDFLVAHRCESLEQTRFMLASTVGVYAEKSNYNPYVEAAGVICCSSVPPTSGTGPKFKGSRKLG